MKKDFETDFTIANAKSAADHLKNLIKEADNPVVDLSGITKIDLSGIQLLLSAQKYGDKCSKKLYYNGTVKKNVYDKLFNNGFKIVQSEETEGFYSIRRNSSEL